MSFVVGKESSGVLGNHDFAPLGKSNKSMENLTEVEVAVLTEELNLADGHAYRGWSSAEEEVINISPNILRGVDRKEQQIIENEYLKIFFGLGKQTLDRNSFDTYMCFTASMALEVIGNYLRLQNMSVSLIEPCFDNLADILKRHHVPMKPFPDTVMSAPPNQFQNWLSIVRTEAVFFVTPNNPTGESLSKENFVKLAQFCKESKKILILDTCFRFYLPEDEIYDQYKILIESGVDFIVVEDTGKTWPTLELKGPFFSVSKSLSSVVSNIYSDFLLHVSPFSIKFMSEFLKLSQQDGRGYIREVVNFNREELCTALQGTFLEPIEFPYMSVSWLKIKNGFTSSKVRDLARQRGVHVLTGNQFFWSNPSKGDSFIRVSLVRDAEMFKKAARILKNLCESIVRS